MEDGHIEATHVESGEDAVEAVVKNPYDIIFMDIGLPGIDGLEATRQIRALPGTAKTVPIVALTGHLREEKLEGCLAAGMQDVFSKPLTRETCASIIKKYFKPFEAEDFIMRRYPVDPAVLDMADMIAQYNVTDDAQLKDLLDVTLEYMPTEMNKLRDAVDCESVPDIKEILHGMRGAVAYMAAPTCNELITKWDEIFQEKNPSLACD